MNTIRRVLEYVQGSRTPYVLAGSASFILATIATNVFLARTLNNADFTTIALIQAALATIVPIFSIPTSTAANSFLPEASDSIRTTRAIYRIAALTSTGAAVTTLVLLLVITTLQETTLHLTELTIATFAAPIQAYSNTNIGVLHGLDRFKHAASTTIVRSICLPLLTIPLTIGYGLKGGIFAITATALISSIIGANLVKISTSKQALLPARETHSGIQRTIFSFTMQSMASSAAAAGTRFFTSLSLLDSASTLNFAVFHIFTQWQFSTQLIPSSLSPTTILSLTREKTRTAFNSARLQFIISSFAPALFVGLASPLIMSLYGIDPKQASLAFVLFIWASAFTSYTSFYGCYLASFKRNAISLTCNLYWCVIFITTFYSFDVIDLFNLTKIHFISSIIYSFTIILAIELLARKRYNQ